MIATEDQVNEWKHAYRVLDIPESASAQEIKIAYRNLVRRWHPDRYRSGSTDQREATRMTEMINSAYAAVESAPLHKPVLGKRVHRNARAQTPPAQLARSKAPASADPLTFWIWFAFGALFGALLGLRFVFYTYVSASTMIIGMAMMILICAFAAGFGGDKLWRIIRHRH